MYHPYLRGKQYELITLREKATLLSEAGFVPIIEPVREALRGLERALEAICEAEGTAIVVVNPGYGDHQDGGGDISAMLATSFQDNPYISAGILLTGAMTVDDALRLYREHAAHRPAFIHAGFDAAKALSTSLGENIQATKHVFIEAHCGKLYRLNFAKASERVLIRDGFKRRKNSSYERMEFFSDLHLTFEYEGATGFGDFLIVGDEFSEGGGPAYAVAIHVTAIDPTKDNAMDVYHFVSTSNDTPTDAPGKFKQALAKLVDALGSETSNIFEGPSIQEFRQLHERGHFPGLGYVKKLSMNHHIETLADHFA